MVVAFVLFNHNPALINTQNQIQTSHQAQNSNENTWLLGNVNKSNSINNHMNELISIGLGLWWNHLSDSELETRGVTSFYDKIHRNSSPIRSNQPLLDNYNQQQREQANKFIWNNNFVFFKKKMFIKNLEIIYQKIQK